MSKQSQFLSFLFLMIFISSFALDLSLRFAFSEQYSTLEEDIELELVEKLEIEKEAGKEKSSEKEENLFEFEPKICREIDAFSTFSTLKETFLSHAKSPKPASAYVYLSIGVCFQISPPPENNKVFA